MTVIAIFWLFNLKVLSKLSGEDDTDDIEA